MTMTTKQTLGWLVLPVLLVVSGAATGAVFADGIVKWAYALVAVVATGCGVATQRWLSTTQLVLRLRDGRRGAPVFYDIAMTDLGVHRAQLARAASEIYVDRDIDGDVRAAVSTGQGLVLVHGPALAGTTRTVVEAVSKTRPGVRVVAFESSQTAALAYQVEQARRWKRADDYNGVVLWLDRLGGSKLFEITTELLNNAESHGVQLLATATSDDVEAAGHLLPDDPRLTVLRMGAVTGSERERLLTVPAFREVTEAHADTPVLLGRLIVSLEQVERHMTPTAPDGQERVALVRAVVDWYRLGVPLSLTKRHLAGLFPLYLSAVLGLANRAETDPDQLERVLQDGLRRRDDLDQPLIRKHGRKRDTTFHPHPLLTALADSDSTAAWTVQPEMWIYLYDTISGSQRLQLGLYAYGRGLRLEASELLIVDTNSALDPAVMQQLGHAEKDLNPDRAGTWWRRIVDSGHPEQAPCAMINLGFLEYQQGNVAQARSWFQRTIECGHPEQVPLAMVNLGVLERKQGNLAEARNWYQQAIESDHPEQAPRAMVDLGLLEEPDDVAQAQRWWQQAVESGHPKQAPLAMGNLGVLKEKQGDIAQARGWWQRTVDSGHPDYAPGAMVNLGDLEKKQGNFDQALNWFQQAIGSGHHDYAPRATIRLGVLGKEQGDIAQARCSWQRTVESGHLDYAPGAMVNLGVLEKEEGNFDQARNWFQQAIESGDPEHAPPAMVNLGVVAKEQGDVAQARTWWQRAIKAGHPDYAPAAMIDLGILEKEQGDVAQACSWWQRAIDTNHLQYGPEAKQLLRTLVEFEQEQQQAQRIARRDFYVDENWVPPIN
jgi:tetratricopeptide (TPR) repeat protein